MYVCQYLYRRWLFERASVSSPRNTQTARTQGLTILVFMLFCTPKRTHQQTESIRVYNASVTVERTADLSADLSDIRTYADQVTFSDGDVLIPHVKANEPLKAQVQHFLDCIKDPSVQQVSDGAMGRDVVKTLCAVDQSIEAGGKSVDIEW
jgi:hypothetical protein